MVSFLPKLDWSIIRLKTAELFTSNTSSTVPSYSDTGKAFSTSAFVWFLVMGVEWLLVQVSAMPSMGWSSVIAACLAFFLHRLILLHQNGSPEKTEAIKTALEVAQDKPPDDPKPPNPPLRMSA